MNIPEKGSMSKRKFRPILAGCALVRRRLTEIKIRQEAKTLYSIPLQQIGVTKRLDILPLYEAVALNGLQQGAGVSYLIRTDEANILFDLGHNPEACSPSPLEQNMTSLGLSLDDIDRLVISHRHPDHVGGMRWWKKRSFSLDGYRQPALGLRPIYVPEKMAYPASRVTLASRPTRLAAGVMTTGIFTFFEPYHVPWILPRDKEQALAINVAGLGIVLICGCGHMGLNVLLQRADSLFNMPVIGVVGGLHYTSAGAECLQSEIALLQHDHIRMVALSPHDSGPAACEAFARAFPEKYKTIKVGELITID
jgi:7,8-dihydropterin-6-yl-methyl-4-(beta-D-ribofuranosyl)aminobenzene 5'-phosphate synthase